MPARLRWTVALALATHAGVAVWVSRAAWRDAPAIPPTEAAELDVEVEPPAPLEVPAEVSGAQAPEPGAIARADARPTTAGRRAAAATEGTQPPAPSAEPADQGSWTFSPTTGAAPPAGGPLSGAALGAAVKAGVGVTVAEETRKEEAREARRRLLPVFTPHDMELGLVPGGAIVTLARDQVRRSRAPLVSRALLEFTTDGGGIVASVRVLDASSGRAEWNEVASQIAADARSSPMRVPSGARGVSVTLEVTSALKTVNGGTPTDSPIAKALGAINDPLGTAMDSRTPAQRVVAARIVDVKAF